MGIVVTLISVVVMFFTMEHLLSLLGASAETRDLAIDFLIVIIPIMPILIAAMMAGAVLRAYGDAKSAMYATLTTGVCQATPSFTH